AMHGELRVVYSALRCDGCHADPILEIGVTEDSDVPLTGTNFYQMFLKEAAESLLYLPAPTETAALNQTPGTFRLLPPHDGASIAGHPSFYQDDTRTFFVAPADLQSPTLWKNGSQIDLT